MGHFVTGDLPTPSSVVCCHRWIEPHFAVRNHARYFRWGRFAAPLFAILVIVLSAAEAPAESALTVAAAISLRDAMPELIEAFEEGTDAGGVAVSYGASGQLRRQVEAGAPIDVIVFASMEDVSQLARRGFIIPGTQRVVATNSLVLVGPIGAPSLTFATIDRLPDDELLAIGEPASVPAGRYAREVLRALGKWDALHGRVIFGGHVAAVLEYARRGEVAAAIIYLTDAANADDIAVLDRATGAWVPRIETVAAAIVGDRAERARSFIGLLASHRGGEILAAHGFGAPGAQGTGEAP